MGRAKGLSALDRCIKKHQGDIEPMTMKTIRYNLGLTITINWRSVREQTLKLQSNGKISRRTESRSPTGLGKSDRPG
jgi:hypothetical protein